jgi:hypothetical protein
MTATQIIKTPWGTTEKKTLPASMLNARDTGLSNFFHLAVRNNKGKVVLSKNEAFCPDTYSYFASRTGPSSALTSPYPQGCGSFDPFPVSNVWGIAKGWAMDPASSSFATAKLPLGTYRFTETINPGDARWFGVQAKYKSVTVKVRVAKGGGGCCVGVGVGVGRPRSLPSLPRHVRTLSKAPAGDLPDLVPLPSWGITTSHVKKTGHDFLNFGATVWVGGNSPLDVEGFRVPGTPVMKAYQYFWHNGKIVGRVRAGTMGFDNKKGHHHWHFEQFGRYTLLSASKKLIVRSEKVGFCIAPTDQVNLLLPHAKWNPTEVGLGGQCGDPGALWVQEYMPIGWGDTYDQYKAGQAFDITHLKNGTYYIEVIANPEHALHEITRSNDVSLRKVIIGGTAAHRTVTVPAWHGIDPEQVPKPKK